MEQAKKRAELYTLLNIAAQRAYARGIQTGSGGNLSARDIEAGQMIVKASGGSFADCSSEGEGFVVTKLDGTAKGGIALAIRQELEVPVWYIGVGEGIDDLQPFNAKDFVEALF